ncbi:MAG: hypothetical protein NTY73_03495 [Candidatus Micrarchaeota archaeon]|nr:hypothetical protein [Candidatus Micrarchaeota archaeon]
MQTKLLLLVGILLCGVTYAASQCSINSYADSCKYCKFDSTGKMNETCYKSYNARGQECIAVHHPILASNYKDGKCPDVDACASQLQSCKNSFSLGDDKVDCNNPLVRECFTDADACIAKAVEKCGGNLDLAEVADLLFYFCPNGIGLSVLLVGAVYAERRSK